MCILPYCFVAFKVFVARRFSSTAIEEPVQEDAHIRQEARNYQTRDNHASIYIVPKGT